MLLADFILRKRAITEDDGYGNLRRDWAHTEDVEYPAEVQPLSAAEDVSDQDRLETRWRLWLYPKADLVPTDRVVWDGQTYEVIGDIEVWKQKGRVHHKKVILIKIEEVGA